ncbi:acetylornithine aminotransferase-like protein [Zopfochytrium polystomum]|nr:acetylornithine aminotransferase-like protein [Zopfochytrium polystomum]
MLHPQRLALTLISRRAASCLLRLPPAAAAATAAWGAGSSRSPARAFSGAAPSRAVTHPDPSPADDPVLAANLDGDRHIIQMYSQPQFFFVRGQGAYLYDTADREFLDMTAGIAVNALGHNDPDVVAAIKEQAPKLIHISQYYKNLHAGPLATKLVNLVPENEKFQKYGAKVFFGNSGSEANEGAIKFARKHAKHVAKRFGCEPEDKFGIVAFTDGFHGRTYGTLSASPNPIYQVPFTPLVPGYTYSAFNNVAALKDSITVTTAAVIIEPVQGEGGIIPATNEFMQAVRQRCDEVGAVLIVDEVQAGGGRTGKFFSHQHSGISPDIITFAKPLANGYPIGAIITSGEVASLLRPGDHGNTFGFNPLAASVANVVLDKLNKPEFLTHVADTGKYFKEQLDARVVDGKVVKFSRGLGLMLALKLAPEAKPARFVELARHRGVLVITSGDNTIRLVPPLIIGKKEVDFAVAAFAEVVAEMAKELKL